MRLLKPMDWPKTMTKHWKRLVLVGGLLSTAVLLIVLWPTTTTDERAVSGTLRAPIADERLDRDEPPSVGRSTSESSNVDENSAASVQHDQAAVQQEGDGDSPSGEPDAAGYEEGQPSGEAAPDTSASSRTIVRVDDEAIEAREGRDGLPYGATLPDSQYDAISRERGNRFMMAARAKLLLGFNHWPGRNTGLLGGLRFVSDDYPMLAASSYELAEGKDGLSRVRPESDGTVWSAHRQVSMTNGVYNMTIGIAVHLKASWAHEALLAVPLSWSSGIGLSDADRSWFRGNELERELGDVSLWSIGVANAKLPPRVYFCRNNVFVSIESKSIDGKQSETDLDLYELARQIDQQVLSQSHAASSFDDLASKSPKINAFWLEPESPKPGYARIHLDAEPVVGKELTLGFRSKDNTVVAGRLEGARLIPDDASPDVVFIRPGTGKTEHTLWACVVGEDLLWTVAEAVFSAPEVKLPYDPAARPRD